ncbi:MAG: hypothetical protein Tsb0014_35420 [Pleurocapsa sp.]
MLNESNSKHNFYKHIYNDYKTKIFNYQEEYYDWYRQANNLLEAINKAFKSEDKDNKVHPHQHRVGRSVLKQATEKALEIYKGNNLSEKDLNTFNKIYNFVHLVRKQIPRFGELANYDISLRIAKYLEFQYPKCGYLTEVYLHRGTLEGTEAIFNAGGMAKNIQNLDLKEGKKISVTSFPSPLNTLSGDHLENLLCIYKHQSKEQKMSNQKPNSCLKPKEVEKVKACV